MHSYEKKSKLHYSEKKNVDSVEKLSKKMEYYDKLFNQFESKFPKAETLKKPLYEVSKEKKTQKEELSPRTDLPASIGDVTARIKQFEIKLADQKEVYNDRFSNMENELKEIYRRLSILEERQQNSNYEEKSKGYVDPRIEERLRKLEEKNEWLSNKLVDEKQLQIKIENFERMRKNSKDRNHSNFQEDILNEINNLYSLLRKSLNNQRDIYLESQNLKKQLNTTKILESENSISKINKFDQKSPRIYEKSPKKYSPIKYSPKKYSPMKYEQKRVVENEFSVSRSNKYEQKSPLKYENKSPFVYEQKSPRLIDTLELENSKRKIYQEMKKDRSFSTGKKLRSIDDDNNMEPPKEKFNNALEDMKYLNYARKKDSFDNQKSIEKLKLEEYQKRNEDLKEKYMVHERIHSYQNDYKRDRDLKSEDIEKRKKIDDEINKRINKENEKRDKFLGNLENKRKIIEKKEEFANNDRDKFKFSPFSTEKSRNQELASRLGLEKKLKEEKIDKLTDSLKYK